MAENLTKDFINLSGRGFSSNRATELGFYHRESGFYIRPFVIMLQEGFSIEAEIMPHSIPQSIKTCCGTSPSPSIVFEGDVGCPTYGLDCVKITTAGIGFLIELLRVLFRKQANN